MTATHSTPGLDSDATVYALRADAARREVDGEFFFVTTDRGMHRVASPSGVAVLRLLAEGPHSAAELVQSLTKRFRADEARISADVSAFLTTLVDKQIAERRGS